MDCKYILEKHKGAFHIFEKYYGDTEAVIVKTEYPLSKDSRSALRSSIAWSGGNHIKVIFLKLMEEEGV